MTAIGDISTHIQVINTTYQTGTGQDGKVSDLDGDHRCVPSLTKDAFDLASGTTDTATFTNTGREFVYIVNASSASIVIDVNDVSICDHGFDHDPIVTAAPAAVVMLGPFPVQWFSSTCSIKVTGSEGDGNPTISVFQLPLNSPTPE